MTTRRTQHATETPLWINMLTPTLKARSFQDAAVATLCMASQTMSCLAWRLPRLPLQAAQDTSWTWEVVFEQKPCRKILSMSASPTWGTNSRTRNPSLKMSWPSIPSRPARTYGPVPYLLANRAGKAWGSSAPLRWGWWHTPAWLTNSATGLTWIQFNAGQLGSGYGGKLSSNQCPKSNFWAWLAVD